MMKPKIVVFAGPNGSGKSTITSKVVTSGKYINADNIKKSMGMTDIDAAVEAERQRECELSALRNFSFETVLSTERNLGLLCRAKDAGYFIRGYYVITCDPIINILRVQNRAALGGHDVPQDKITQRYHRAIKLLPQFIDVCDICSIYDNSDSIFRIYKKHHGDIVQSNKYWSIEDIVKLINGKWTPTEQTS